MRSPDDPQAFHESGDVGVGQRLLMPARELGGLRQQLVQMAFPAGWVGLVVGDVAQRLRGVEHGLDAPLSLEAVRSAG